jgi:SAM-dependent methyltransferase
VSADISNHTWRDRAYWQGRFTSGDTPWELGAPSSVVIEALGELESRGFQVRGASVLSPGCGTASDALELVRRGARVVGVDWSEVALGVAKARYETERAELVKANTVPVGSLVLHQGDFFSIPPHQVDLVCEHTFFCAIDPSMRPRYTQAIAAWVKPQGFLAGNFFVLNQVDASSLPGLSMTREGYGPPFASTQEEIERLFSPYFDVAAMRPAKHPDPNRRPGMEWVCVFQRRPGC